MSIGKRIALMLGMSICLGFGTAAYPTGPPVFANTTKQLLSSSYTAPIISITPKD
jgi:hypothetical protein